MDKILTLEEVAAYLKVSERTVVAWVEKGIFPGGKVGTAWRFKFVDVEAWLSAQLSSHRVQPFDGRTLTIEEVISLKSVKLGDFDSKKNLMKFLAKTAVENKILSSQDLVLNEIWNRESLMSTGIGLGIAIPHIKLAELKDIEVILVINSQKISDYESVDEEPIQIIAFILAGLHMQKEYLKVLSSVVGLLKNRNIRESLLACTESESAYKVITGKF